MPCSTHGRPTNSLAFVQRIGHHSSKVIIGVRFPYAGPLHTAIRLVTGGRGRQGVVEIQHLFFWLTFSPKGTIINARQQRKQMKYTLITANGKVLTFFLRTVAETFQQAYGGQLITADILVDEVAQTCYN